jgi:hypothetical protein
MRNRHTTTTIFRKSARLRNVVRLLFALGIAACRTPGSTALPEARADEPLDAAADGVAVVELFTSEGCSSCPPADAVLAEVARTARSGGRRIYTLGFHVDYWDSLGWPDPFASPDFTARQRTYARAFGTSGMYTPQMVVDGREQFVGSDASRAGESIARALARPAPARLSIHARPSGPNAFTIDYEVTGAPAGATIDIAAVERAKSVAVHAGENEGRTLHHTDVVRAFAVASLARPSGTRVLSVPEDFARDGGEVVAFVQAPSADGEGMPVLGASRASLPR